MRVCGMMHRALTRIQPWFLVFMTLLPSINCECPSDVQSSTSQCLTEYEIHSAAQTDEYGQINFYTGIDAENIRSICKTLSKSMQCVIQIQHSCPVREHSKILTVVEGPLVNVAQLCHYHNFYELYSRHQYCFANVKAESDACYKDFTRETASLNQNREVANHHDTRRYCRYLDIMINCVKSNFQSNCGSEAAKLAEQLVKSSVRNSDTCKALEDSPQQMTTESQYTKTTVPGGLHDSRIGPNNASPSNAKSITRSTAFLAITSFFITLYLVHS